MLWKKYIYEKTKKMNNNNNNLGFTNKQDGLCSICMLFTHTWKDEGNPGNAPTIFYWRVDCQIGHQSCNPAIIKNR